MSDDPPTHITSPPSGPVTCLVCGSSLPIGSHPGTCPGCLLLGGLHRGERLDGGLLPDSDDDASGIRIGMVIDRYQLEKRLGKGGMGEVFLALQIAPVRRLVAVKVIKRGMDTEHIVARFQTERQSLALMDHPNIATVLDAGATPSGRPYFVMEHVEGVPINRYCTERHLTPRDGVKLILQVCSAVQHAHQKGIIHRDLKPSNILVQEKDGQPLPKVIDFGLAKAVERETLVTEAGQILGTPDYMAPEQASGSPDADTRLDVYSLGAVLYELLAGQPPFVGKNPTEILRRVQEQDPVAPHTLNRLVDRDIETVCLKCLEKEPARRYASADALADDLNRWLARRPVRARPVSSIGRVVKWAERRPGIAALSGALSVSLIAGTIGIISALRQANAARHGSVVNERLAVVNERLALVAEARANRSSDRGGRRWAALTALGKAATIDSSDLANDVISTLALDDIRVQPEWEGNPGSGLAAFDAPFERYARSFPDGRIEVRRMKDDSLLATIPATGIPLKSVLRFSTDGKWLVSAHAPGEEDITGFRLWDLGASKQVLTGASRDDAIDFSDNGVFAAAAEKTITLWHLPGIEVVARWEVPLKPYALRFSPDGRTLAVTSRESFSILLLDVATGDVRHLRSLEDPPLPVDEAGVTVPSWHPSGNYLTGPGGEGRISLWDARSFDLIGSLLGHKGPVAQAVWHPSGDLIVSDSADGTIALWDPATRQRIVRMDGGFMPNAGFSPDGKQFGPARKGKSLSILETEKTDTRRRLMQSRLRECRSAEWDPKGAVLATAGDVGVQLWDRMGHFLRTVTSQGAYAAIFTDDNSLITSGVEGVLRWPLSPRPGKGSLTLGSPRILLHDPASKQAAVDGLERKILAVIQPGQLTVLDLTGRTAPQQVPAAPQAESVSVSPDGRWIAAGNRNGTDVGIWEMPGLVRTTLPIGGPSRVAFSWVGKWLLVSTATEHQFRHVESWKPEHQVPSHDAEVFGFGVFGRLGVAIALSASRHQMRIVGASDFVEWVAPDAAQSRPLCFSPDSTLLAAADESEAVEIWNLGACIKGLLQFDIHLPIPGTLVPHVPDPVTAVVASVFHEGQPERFPPRPAGINANTLDLTLRYNATLDEGWAHPVPAPPRSAQDTSTVRPLGGMLGPLPESPWHLDGVDFDARGIVQLQGRRLLEDMPEFPRIIPRFPIGRSCRRLHLLHGSVWPEKDEVEVARHRVHYADGTVEEMSIVYGRDVRDWVLLSSALDGGQPPAWQQPTTQPSQVSQWSRRLYHLTWENPHPAKQIESLSLVSTMSKAAPFVLAVTVE